MLRLIAQAHRLAFVQDCIGSFLRLLSARHHQDWPVSLPSSPFPSFNKSLTANPPTTRPIANIARFYPTPTNERIMNFDILFLEYDVRQGRGRTWEAHCKIDPIAQIQPDAMIVFLLPRRSASCDTARAPTNDPAGMDATRAP